jgi:cobalt-zinc-cadmium efflux system outer membrane protein
VRPNATVPIVLAILGVILPGCAEYTPAPLSPEASAKDLDSRSLDDPRLRDFIRAALAGEAHDGAAWDLTALTLAAVYYHPDLDVARARLAVARAAVVTAGQRPNPVLNLTAEIDRAAVAGAIPAGALPLTIGPVINLILESFGKREARIAQAAQLGQAARWDLATASWQVRGKVRDAFLDLWAARQKSELARRRLALQDELVGLLERRVAAGEASAVEVGRERLARAQIAVDRGVFERAADEALAQLAAAVAVPLRALAPANLSFAAFDAADPAADSAAAGEWPRRALTGRSDVQAALAQYEAAQAALQLAVAKQYPDVGLGPGYVYDAGIEKFSLSPAIELPLFHQNQGQIAEALAKREQAAAEFTQLQARVLAAIDTALAGHRAARRALATADELVAGSRRREGQVAAALRAGQGDRPSLIAAQLEAAAVALAQFDARLARLKALAALEDALQYPLFAPAAALAAPETRS